MCWSAPGVGVERDDCFDRWSGAGGVGLGAAAEEFGDRTCAQKWCFGDGNAGEFVLAHGVAVLAVGLAVDDPLGGDGVCTGQVHHEVQVGGAVGRHPGGVVVPVVWLGAVLVQQGDDAAEVGDVVREPVV